MDLKSVTQSTRISANPADYKILSGASKAAHYYNEHMANDDPFVAGDSVQWTYVSAVPNGLPATKVVAYREPAELEGFELDAKTILNKSIEKKLTVFSMSWVGTLTLLMEHPDPQHIGDEND